MPRQKLKSKNVAATTSKIRDYNDARIACMNQWLSEHAPDEILAFAIQQKMNMRQISYLLKKNLTLRKFESK